MVLLAMALAPFTFGEPALAADAAWLSGPVDGDFNNAANWDTAGVPDGTATFGASSITSLSFSANRTLGGFTIDAGTYSFTTAYVLAFNGAGIAVNGGSAALTNNGWMGFYGTATAGSAAIAANSGEVHFFDDSTAGAAAITINGGAYLDFHQSSTAGDAAIANAGTLRFWDTSTAGSSTISNSNTLSFISTSTAGGATISNSAAMAFNDDSTAGTASIANNSGAFLLFYGDSTAGSATVINGSGAIMDFNQNSMGGDATIGNEGSLRFFNASTAGSAAITTVNGGSVHFLQTSSGGDARFITEAGGTFYISGLSSAGTTAGSIEGAGNHVLGDRSLTAGSNDLSTEVSGVISGSGGSLTKSGNGTLTLSGVNTYTGGTSVNGGTLSVNGSIASSSLTTVNAGGTLGGTGTLGSTTINGGTLAPGNSIGTITVQGDLVFAPGSTYEVELSSSADRTNVTGTGTLDGTVHAVYEAGGSLQRSYTILSAAGGLGGSTFDAITGSLPAAFSASLGYSGNDVLLNLAASVASPGGQNQSRAADAITSYFNNGGSLPPQFVSVLGLSGEQLKAALSQVSGEATAAARSGAGQASTQFLGAMFAPRVTGPVNSSPTFGLVSSAPVAVPIAYGVGEGPVPWGHEQQAWTNWVSVFGGVSRLDGSAGAGSHDVAAHAYGFAAGLDYQATEDATIGFAFSGGNSFWGLSDGLGGGASRDFQLGLNGTVWEDYLYGTAALAYGFHRMSTERYAVGSRLTAAFDAQSVGGRIEGGARLDTGEVGITPYAAVQVQSFVTPGYSEDDPGGSGFALSYAERTSTSTRAELGSRFDHALELDDETRLNLNARLAYAHDWFSDPSLSASFQSLPGASFIVNGATPPRSLALTSLGAELALGNGVALSGRFDGEFAQGAASYAGVGAIRVSW